MTAHTPTTLAAADYAARLADANSVGRATDRLAARYAVHAAAIVANVPESYDWTARGAVPQAVHLFVSGHLKGSEVPAQKKADLTPTPYGTYVDGVKSHIKALVDAPAPVDESAPAMRVALKGVGSAVVPADHPAYPLLLALLGADADADAEADAA